jgi:pyruvate dehydrogenase E1 component beta subunit
LIFSQGVDDFRGTFGTTIGLAEKYGAHRVFDTPLAEDSMTGVAIGAALGGLYPIQSHIRVDFALLAANQIINLAAKYRYMSGGRCKAPLFIRMIIGRSWGQGAQHSQSLQSLFAHIPGLTVLMPASAQSILDDYSHAFREKAGPVLAIEHRLLYDTHFRVRADQGAATPPASLLLREGSDVTIVATSIMAVEALRAATYLQETAGIRCDVIDVNKVSHPDRGLILSSVKKTGRLLVADTSWAAYGVCAEICRMVCEEAPGALKAPAITVAMEPTPCPTGKTLEDLFYPTFRGLIHKLAALAKGREDHGVPLPQAETMVAAYRQFKGPF